MLWPQGMRQEKVMLSTDLMSCHEPPVQLRISRRAGAGPEDWRVVWPLGTPGAGAGETMLPWGTPAGALTGQNVTLSTADVFSDESKSKSPGPWQSWGQTSTALQSSCELLSRNINKDSIRFRNLPGTFPEHSGTLRKLPWIFPKHSGILRNLQKLKIQKISTWGQTDKHTLALLELLLRS